MKITERHQWIPPALVAVALSIAWQTIQAAETGLAHSNVANYVGPLDGTSAGRTWVRPTATTPVLSCPPGTAAADCAWGKPAFAWRKFGDLAADAFVNVCAAAIEPGPFAPPNRPGVDPKCGDPCGCGDALDRKTNVLKSAVQLTSTPAATFTNLPGICKDAAPPTGTSCSTLLVFDVPTQTTIVKGAGGYFAAWSGFSAPGGVAYVCTAAVPKGTVESACPSTATVPYKEVYGVVNTTGQLTLEWGLVSLCTDPTDNVTKACNDPAHPTWAIQGYRVYSGVSADALGLLQTVGASVSTLVLPGYGDGTYYFAVTAFNGQGESVKSSIASVEVKKPTTPVDSKAIPTSVEGVRLKVTF